MDRPLQVGVTGGIGSGKSLVCRIFHCLGVPIYDADSRAKALMATDEMLINQIKKEFGPAAYRGDGSIDRAYLSGATFGKPERLKVLNSFVHPRVAQDYTKWVGLHKDNPYLVREAALLYEVGADKHIDKMIVVTSPVETRIKRVLARDPQRSEEEIKAIMNSQWPEEEKLKKADYIVYNDDEHMVIPQVLRLHSLFQ